jgi:hypothetical protein
MAIMTVAQAQKIGLTDKQIAEGQALGIIAKVKEAAKAKGLSKFQAYTPKSHGKGTGVYLVCGTYGSQLFMRVNDGTTLTEEGRATAVKVLEDLKATVEKGEVVPEVVKASAVA